MSGGVIRFLAAAVFSSGLIAADLRLGAFDSLRGQMSLALTPFRYAAELPQQLWSATGDYLSARSDLLAEKSELEERLSEQSARVQSLDFFVAQNDQLRALLNLKERIPGRWISADVRRETSQLRQSRIYLQLGVRDGVLPGMTVVDDAGIVGQVVRADAGRSAVNLLSNPRQWIATRVRRTGQLAIVRGAGDGEMEIYSMPGGADLRPGDQLIADGGAFPPGYPVGEVKTVSRGVRYLSASVSPSSDFYEHRTLLIYAEGLPLAEDRS